MARSATALMTRSSTATSLESLGLVDLEGHHRASVETGEAALLRLAVADLRNVGQAHVTAGGGDHRAPQRVHRGGGAQHPHGLLALAYVGAAAGFVCVELAAGRG